MGIYGCQWDKAITSWICSIFVLISGRRDSPVYQSVFMLKVNARRPVSRVLSSALPPMDDHSSGTPITGGLARPTRTTMRKRIFRRTTAVTRTCPEGHPYLVLLQVGFTLPTRLPEPRCAFTAPFHPYRRAEASRRFVFCGTVPGVAPAGSYPAPCLRGARTFLASSLKRGHPAVWQAEPRPLALKSKFNRGIRRSGRPPRPGQRPFQGPGPRRPGRA